MKTIREQAVYLPSNVDYLARNNGFDDSSEALNKLVSSDWVSAQQDINLTLRFKSD